MYAWALRTSEMTWLVRALAIKPDNLSLRPEAVWEKDRPELIRLFSDLQ